MAKQIKDISCMDGKELLRGLEATGFQATQLAEAIRTLRAAREKKATMFFGFTANMVASGLRGLIAEWVKNKWVDAIVTTGGALDHDLIRSYEPYGLGSFFEDDSRLHKKGINRIGNILVPTERYELLEKKIRPVFEKCAKEQGNIVAPSELAQEIGLSIKDKGSFLHWAARNRIPVFCPGITDSAIGLQTYFHKQRNREFVIDVTKDMKALADLVLGAERTSALVLGGGISKHHVIGANILRGGLDYAVYVTTAQPWDGSLSGARTNEAVSWGKIRERGAHVTVDCDATIAFPLIHLGLLE